LVAARLHPDIYMNELLQGMRIIHQVLPAIIKKLGMDEKDFALDRSQLYVARHRQPTLMITTTVTVKTPAKPPITESIRDLKAKKTPTMNRRTLENVTGTLIALSYLTPSATKPVRRLIDSSNIAP
jgi:hypothetical protein